MAKSRKKTIAEVGAKSAPTRARAREAKNQATTVKREPKSERRLLDYGAAMEAATAGATRARNRSVWIAARRSSRSSLTVATNVHVWMNGEWCHK
jgi:hypothetical protein